MAEQDTLLRVAKAIDERTSFIVEAGAGSGKTFALVYGLRHILETRRAELARHGKQVACITYTKVAKAEIARRVGEDPLIHVATIHEFIWSMIGRFQTEMKPEVLSINRGNSKVIEGLDEILPSTRITYSDRPRNFLKGRVSHDDILDIASRLFKKYPKIARLAADKYPYLFIDEYQDTNRAIVNLILQNFRGAGKSGAVVGFFGDSMQKIYKTGAGAVSDDRLQVITKKENYRCSKSVIRVLNQMRLDLQQVAAGENVEGDVHFFKGSGNSSAVELAKIQKTLRPQGWTDDNTKILMLTHRGIAGTLRYENLLAAFKLRGSFGQERLISGDDAFVHVFDKIELLSQGFETKNFSTVIQILASDSTRINRHADKVRISSTLKEMIDIRHTGTVGEVLDFIYNKNLLSKSSAIKAFEERLEGVEQDDDRIEKDREFMKSLREVPYNEVVELVKFREESTPFSTQHGVKGEEYENVIVIIDDKAWTQYNMDKMLAGSDKEERSQRSLNLFYVCCSRAKSGLAILFLSDLSPAAHQRVLLWFGNENFHEAL